MVVGHEHPRSVRVEEGDVVEALGDVVAGVTVVVDPARRVDPHGAALHDWYAHGELRSEGSSVAEGIGQGRITGNLEGAVIDTQFRVSDEEGLEWGDRLLSEEGLCLGLSSGINVAGAVRLGRALGPGKRVATILCDTGFRYLSTLYNRDWLAAKGLSVPDRLLPDRVAPDRLATA